MRNTIEGVVIAVAVIMGFFILALSLVSFYNDFVNGKNVQYFIVDFIFFGFGLTLVCGSLRIYKRLVMFSVVTESIFEDVMYRRLKPLFDMVASGTIDMNEVKTRIVSLEKRIEKMEEALTKPIEAPERFAFKKTAFYMRTVVTLIIFLGVYNFFLSYTFPYEPYFYTILYIIWWAFVTMEFNLFHKIEAWIILGIPILIVPSSSLILAATVGFVPLMGIIFVTTFIYAYLYYLYAKSLSIEKGSKKEENFFNEKIKESLRKILRWLRS